MNILFRIFIFHLCGLLSFTCFANYNQNLHYKKSDNELLTFLKPTIEYLDGCHTSKFDWTTSLPIKSLSSEARMAGIKSFSHDDIHTYYNNTLHENILDSIEKYFNTKNIQCGKENIKLRYTAFDILNDFYSLLDPNSNKILTVSPTFGYYVLQASQHNIKMSIVPTKSMNDWKITPQELDEALQSSKANIFLLTNPVNPTGVFYSKKELEALAQILIKHNVFLISDEIFSELYFGKDKPSSIGSINGMQKRTLTLSGLGKVKGVRLSFACSPIAQIPTLPVSGILKPVQAAAVAAINNTENNEHFLTNTIKQYNSRIQFIQSTIDSMNIELNKHYNTKHITYMKPFIIPKSTNVFLISFPGYEGGTVGVNDKITNSLDLAKYLYKVSGVATVPGEGFFIDGHQMTLRIPMSISENELREGFALILKALKNIKIL